ncbi:MAG: LacI family transcriptional regulator [Bifidobacteriaceae bacterium]|jgi:DNA-binding LacI/PurR family transcriptional regulator|nr:LacI family transcriptional regulator [Bifidobacteriaceae bacterium]
MNRITSRDVARATGLSRTTVSLVLNRKDADQRISEETRRLVLDAADRLGYIPSAAARELGRGQSQVVLCALPRLPVSELAEQLKQELSQAIAEVGLTLLFARVGEAAGRMTDILRNVTPAVVIAPQRLDPVDSALLARLGIPLVDAWLDPDRPGGAIFDGSEVGCAQILHLAARGHQRIAYAAVGDPLELSPRELRVRGARQACADLGLPVLTVGTMNYSRAQAARLLDRWRDRGITAIAAFNDTAGLALLAASRSLGLSVPRDIAVIGTDNLPSGALADPPLSSLAFDLRSPARVLAHQVLVHTGAAETPPAPSPNTWLRVVPRASTASHGEGPIAPGPRLGSDPQ